MKEKMLIMLATGKTGYAATVQLLSEGYDVRIYVRSRNERAMELERLGAEIAIGAFDNYTQLKQAMEGISNVYYCYPYKKGMPEEYFAYKNELKSMGNNTLADVVNNENVSRSYPVTEFTLLQDIPIEVDENGYFNNIDLFMDGFWGWWEKMATRLPNEYEP